MSQPPQPVASQPTARQWLTVLQASHLVTLLAPHHRNFGKRLVQTPKLYFLDGGLLCSCCASAAPTTCTRTPCAAPCSRPGSSAKRSASPQPRLAARSVLRARQPRTRDRPRLRARGMSGVQPAVGLIVAVEWRLKLFARTAGACANSCKSALATHRCRCVPTPTDLPGSCAAWP